MNGFALNSMWVSRWANYGGSSCPSADDNGIGDGDAITYAAQFYAAVEIRARIGDFSCPRHLVDPPSDPYRDSDWSRRSFPRREYG